MSVVFSYVYNKQNNIYVFTLSPGFMAYFQCIYLDENKMVKGLDCGYDYYGVDINSGEITTSYLYAAECLLNILKQLKIRYTKAYVELNTEKPIEFTS